MKKEECRELDKITTITTLILLVIFLIYLFITNIKLFFAAVLSLITITLIANEIDDCEEEKNE